MKGFINRFYMWILLKIIRKVVIQGSHKRKIVCFYCELIKAARQEFNEDNKYTLDGFLEDCHKQALKLN